MAKNEFDFELNRKISNQLAFSVVLVLSFLVACFSVYAGGKIVETAKNSPSFNVQKRMDNAKLNDNKPSVVKNK